MSKPAPALLSSILSYTLIAGMCPAAAFAEMTNEVQQPAIEEAVKTGDAATIEEVPAEDATEEQPEEDVIQPEEPSSDAVETPSDETVANEGESTGDGTESAAETVDGTEATTPTEGADPITVRDKPPMNFGGEHSAHCLRYGQAPRGRQSGASGWPPAPAPKRTGGGVATGGARRSERLIENCRARGPRPGNVGVEGRVSDRPYDWRIPPWRHPPGRESS